MIKDFTSKLDEIKTSASLVEIEYLARDAAIAIEREAEMAILDAAIQAAMPALKACASAILRESYSTSGRNGCNPVEREDYFEERGFVLSDEYERSNDSTGNSGSVHGKRLYLLSDGRLVETERAGTFSRWQGAATSWTVTLREISTREAMNEYRLDDCVTAIANALDEQINGRGKEVAKKATERAERLRAMVALSK